MKLLRTFLLLSVGCTVPHEGLQPAPVGPCTTAADCDDGIECTNDTCESDICVSTPDDSLCAGEDQVCSPLLRRCTDGDECVPEQCAMDRRLPGTCQVGVCMGEDCALGPVNSACGAGESCCGNGLCAFCDDGSPCTTDSCDLTAPGCDPESPTDACCSHVPFDGDCDDGSFCNGPETCVAGTCVEGDAPCEADSTCMEAIDRCDSCVSDAGCPDAPGPWSPCAQNEGAFCNNTGTRTRTVETSRCVEGACVAAAPRTETDASCAFDPTTLGPCMAPTMPAFDPCTFPTTPCAGTQTRTVTTFSCRMDGTCQGTGSTERRGCNASAGTTCNSSTMTPFGACGGFMPVECGVDGTQSRTITTFACSGSGSCLSTTVPDSRPCMRGSRDGVTCGSPITGRPCLPDGVDSCTGTRVVGTMCAGGTCADDRTDTCTLPSETVCGEDVLSTPTCMRESGTCVGQMTRTRTPRVCDSSGSCSDGTTTIETMGPCPLDEFDGDPCDDEDACTSDEACDGGTCQDGTVTSCSASTACGEPGCMGPGNMCVCRPATGSCGCSDAGD